MRHWCGLRGVSHLRP